MEPDVVYSTDPKPRGPGTAVLGVVMIILGVICGGGWTVLVSVGEDFLNAPRSAWNGVPLATVLTLVATLSWIGAGVALVLKGSRPPEQLVNAGKNLGVGAACLLSLAVCLYILGCVCLCQVLNWLGPVHGGTDDNRETIPAVLVAFGSATPGSGGLPGCGSRSVRRFRARHLSGVPVAVPSGRTAAAASAGAGEGQANRKPVG
jgi:amino acid transporter